MSKPWKSCCPVRECLGTAWAAVCAMLLAAPGCGRNVYELELTPQGDSLQRDLTAWRERAQNETTQIEALPAEELAKLAQPYRAAVPAEEAKKHRFSGSFRAKTPDDVGGAGWYYPLECPMGSLGAYVERFRGSDDLAADLDQRLQAIDRLTALLCDYLRTQITDPAEAAPLVSLVQGELRRDLRNLCLYVWAYGIVGQYEEDATEELAVRAVQYLVERRYFDPPAIPRLLRGASGPPDPTWRWLLEPLQRIVARKMGVADDQPVPGLIATLLDPQRLPTAFGKFAEQTPEYQRLWKEWEANRETTPDAKRPQPTEVLGLLLEDAFLPEFALFGASDALKVKLKLPCQPFATNGTWDGPSASVSWSKDMPARDKGARRLSVCAYAFWAVPREAYQKQHFGRVLLQGEQLAQFCLWHCGLSPEEADAWDRFVETLKPGEDLADRVKRFVFSGEPPVKDLLRPPVSVADEAKSLILSQLTKEDWPPPRDAPEENAEQQGPPSAPAPAPPARP